VTAAPQPRISAPFGQGIAASLPIPTAQSKAMLERLPFNNLSGILSGVGGNKGEANVNDNDGMVFRVANGTQ
jgi:hypothetical protein